MINCNLPKILIGSFIIKQSVEIFLTSFGTETYDCVIKAKLDF